MYERPDVNVKVERGRTFTFTRDLPYIACILFTRVKFRACARKNCARVEIHPKAVFQLVAAFVCSSFPEDGD